MIEFFRNNSVSEKRFVVFWYFIRSTLIVFAGALLFSCSAETPDADERVAPASTLIQTGSSLTLTGEASYHGNVLDWTMTINADGSAVSEVAGAYNATTGYDGKTTWRIENGAGPFRIDFSERETWMMLLLALTNRAESIADLPGDLGKAGQYKVSDGELIFEQVGDREWRAANSPNEEAIAFSDDDLEGFVGLPRKIEIRNIGKISEYRVLAAEVGPVKENDFFIRPERITDGFRFLDGVDEEILVRQAPSGHMFVRPLINGTDVGWFLFDSGAAFSGISGEIARKEGFGEAGAAMMGGIGGDGPSAQKYRGGPVQLGPLKIDNLTFVDLGSRMGKASKMLGEPVVGVLGWDILTRAIVEVDFRDGKMSIRDPAKYRAPAQYRAPLYIHWGVPYMHARFEGDKEGFFMFDTGAGSRGIVFTNYSSKRLGLLEQRAGSQGVVTGAGGDVSSLTGEVDWFEIGGHRTSPAPAIFLTSEDNEADIFTVGFLGGAVVSPFVVSLNYGKGEVGFLPRKE